MVELDQLILQARRMEPLPASAVRLAALVQSPDANLEEVNEVVAYDQALTLALLRAANSVVDGAEHVITQVHEAVFRLGAARVLSLVLAAGTRKMLVHDASAYGFCEGALWRHSVAATTAAETLAEFARVTLPPETLAAALLHDVGKLVMSRYLTPKDLELIARARQEGGLDPLAAEAEILGVHHGELGGIVAQHWNLPDSIVQGIIYHHNPTQGRDLICYAVYLANQVARRIEDLPETTPTDATVWESLGIAESEMERLCATARDHFDVVCARYNAP